MIRRHKLAFIGCGNIGGTLAHLAAHRCLGDIVVLDTNEGAAAGKALDISQSAPVEALDTKILGTSNYADIQGSDVVIVTAGIARKPGMSRDDLLYTNRDIINTIGIAVKQYCPNAFVIVVTNPLDAMVYAFQKASGLPHHMVVGMAGILDTSRFKLFLAEALGVSVEDVSTIILGGHGDTMVPLIRHTSIAGIPLQEVIQMGWISETRIQALIERTRNGGAEIVNLLQNGSAFYAPASAAIEMAMSYLQNRKRLLPCAAYLNGQYGVDGLYIGVPVIIGAAGVEKIIELELHNDDKASFELSVQAVRSLISNMERQK